MALVAVLGLSGVDERDEFACEVAVAHLEACCPSFDPTAILCATQFGCGKARDPDIDREQADCIVALSCEAVKSRGLCTRIPRAVAQDMGGNFCP